ncbi:hypothetical protein GIB67_030356 [Kingdonia uniflora]|uniref:Uncharacterized protein n=1 Tax=Kingdonia uniflora TaxID=39325 RepID=A0A7J7M6Q9_9MAGN|nr:hypothetical protein GIB67_030356 [Kingdonia uniflora]
MAKSFVYISQREINLALTINYTVKTFLLFVKQSSLISLCLTNTQTLKWLFKSFKITALGVHDSVYEAQAHVAAMANAKIPSQIINNVPRMVGAPTVASSFHHLKVTCFYKLLGSYMGVVFLLAIIFPRQLQNFHGSWS